MIKVYLIIKQLTNNKKINHVKRLFSVICKKFRLKIAVFVIHTNEKFSQRTTDHQQWRHSQQDMLVWYLVRCLQA